MLRSFIKDIAQLIKVMIYAYKEKAHLLKTQNKIVNTKRFREFTTSPTMVSTGLSKLITQPVTGLTLLALIAIGCPSPSQAQVPNSNRLAQVPGQAAQPVQPGEIDYILGGGDRIRINVFDVPEYTGEYQIPPGGNLYLPLIGAVTIRGLTQEQAAEVIGARYSRFLKRPLVTVSLIAPRPINVVVSGEVSRPGSFTVGLQGGAGDNPGVQYPTVTGALALAEGVTLAADLRQVQLRRKTGSGPEQVINVDLTELVKTGNVNKDLTLRDGDIVFVPTATSVNMAEVRQFATTNFAATPTRPRTVNVVGEVNRPGPYVVIGGASTQGITETEGGGGNAGGGLPTVSRAIQLAGGITSEANVRNIQIRRPTKTGGEQTLNINFWQLLEGDSNQDTLVQEGDTIFVPTATTLNAAESTELADANFSPVTIQVSVVGEVENPGLVNLPPNTPLNQALLTAGGFNNSRARRGAVELVRLNPDGSVTRRKVPINLQAGINEKNNPTLRDDDIVVVSRNGIARIGDTLGTVLNPVAGVNTLLRLFGLNN